MAVMKHYALEITHVRVTQRSRACAMAHCAVLPRWLTARSCRDGRCAVLPRWSSRGPAAMVAARPCRDGRCAVLPRWSLRGPAAMARCAVLPRWLTARSCRDGRCTVLPRCVFQTWKRPRRRYAVFHPARSSRKRPYVSKNDARA